jgi:regulator of sigma E protease
MLITLIVFILMLGLLIFVHEFGHYIVAVKKGIKVDELAFGFGPKIFSFQGKKTLFKINLIPLGGYVKLSDEFEKKSVSKRMQVIVAGVLMNLFLAIFLIFIVYGIVGGEARVDEYNRKYLVYPQQTSIIITKIEKGSPAYNYQLRPGDIILGFETIESLRAYIRAQPKEKINLSILRNQDKMEIRITPDSQGRIGVELGKIGVVRYPLVRAVGETFGLLSFFVEQNFIFLGELIRGEIERPGDYVGGPVKIFQVMDQIIIPRGTGSILIFIGLISAFLVIVNILPFPPLDGGHLLFLIVEGARRKPVSPKIQNTFNVIGMTLLILLVIVITINDIIRLI